MPSKIFSIWSAPSPLPLDNDSPLPTLQQRSNKTASSSALEVRRPSMDHIKRPTLFAKKHSSQEKAKSKERAQSKDKHPRDGRRSPGGSKPIKLALDMESPPILMHDAPNVSSGSLISGQVQITANVPEATLSSIVMYLECTTTTKRPVQDRCRECMSQVKDLFEWHFLKQPKTFKAANGMYEMPFSQVIPGHIPATTHGTITSIDYQLHIRAHSIDGQEIEFRRELIIRRALRPGNDKNSVRVFPPTNLTLHVTLPNVVPPEGEIDVQCRMTGITTKREETQTRWRLRKLNWRIEEHETAVSPACSAHSAKVGGEGKGIAHTHSRDIGHEELKQGWKTDFSDGIIEGQFYAFIDGERKANCGMEAPNGSKITHNMIMELVIAEEWAPNKKPGSATPTGAARVLRTQFALNVTERSGMGIAWDDEQPPMYEDVPDSPPQYPNSLPRYHSSNRLMALGMTGMERGESSQSASQQQSPQNSPHETVMEDYEGPDLDVEGLSLNL